MNRQLEQLKLEHWCSMEPFLSTHRTIGHIESASVISRSSSPALLVRGWLFDKRRKISAMKVSINPGDSDVSVYGIERLDVITNFPSHPQSRLSGFMSVLPIPGALPERVKLQGSYLCEDGQISFVFETSEVSAGITRIGRIIRPALTPGGSDKRWLAAVLVPGQPLNYKILSQISAYAAEANNALHIFSDRDRSTLQGNGMHQAANISELHELDELAGVLCLPKSPVAEVILLGAVDRSLFCEHIAPALVQSPSPKISWVTPAKYIKQHPLPPELRGDLVKFYENGQLTATL